jgi:hypothetical protein
MSKLIYIFVIKFITMGWGTSFTPEIYINKKHYNTILDVLEDILEVKGRISAIKNELLILSSMTPNFNEKSLDEVVFEIRVKLEDLFEELDNSYYDLNTLELLKNHIEQNKEVIND